MKLAEEYHQIQRRGDQDANKNLNHETNPRPLVKQASLNPQNEQTRQNILNNNLNDNTKSANFLAQFKRLLSLNDVKVPKLRQSAHRNNSLQN